MAADMSRHSENTEGWGGGPSVHGHNLNNKDTSTDQDWFSTFNALC